MIRIFCDKCGKEIKGGKMGYIAVNVKDQETGDLLQDNEFEHSHFCQGCTEQIRKFIKKTDGGSDTRPDPKSDQKEEKTERQGRDNIDIGKIMALRKAGWTNKEIAAEMRLTPQAVSYQISVYRKKHGLDSRTNEVAPVQFIGKTRF